MSQRIASSRPLSARVLHSLLPRTVRPIITAPIISRTTSNQAHSSIRTFSTSQPRRGILPHAEDPAPPKTASAPPSAADPKEPAPISDETYHELADAFLAEVSNKVDELAETRDDVNGEFEQGVLTISFPPAGTYVLNKQPTNKQIWLSSPVSGPKRYDFIVAGEGMHGKQGSGVGEWVYLRDGERLADLLRKELGVSVILSGEGDGTGTS